MWGQDGPLTKVRLTLVRQVTSTLHQDHEGFLLNTISQNLMPNLVQITNFIYSAGHGQIQEPKRFLLSCDHKPLLTTGLPSLLDVLQMV